MMWLSLTVLLSLLHSVKIGRKYISNFTFLTLWFKKKKKYMYINKKKSIIFYNFFIKKNGAKLTLGVQWFCRDHPVWFYAFFSFMWHFYEKYPWETNIWMSNWGILRTRDRRFVQCSRVKMAILSWLVEMRATLIPVEMVYPRLMK